MPTTVTEYILRQDFSVHRLCSSSWILVMLCAPREEMCGSPQSLQGRISSLAPTSCRASMDNCDVTEGISTKRTKRLRCSLQSMEQPQWDARTPRASVASPEQPRYVPTAPPEPVGTQETQCAFANVSPEVFVWSIHTPVIYHAMNYLMPKARLTVLRVAKTGNLIVNNLV